MQYLNVNLQKYIFQFSALQIFKLINNRGTWGMGPEGDLMSKAKQLNVGRPCPQSQVTPHTNPREKLLAITVLSLTLNYIRHI